MTNFLEVSGINVSYGDTPVLFDVTLDAGLGDLVAIAGPSGCGKTTLLRTILGLERAESGTIRLGRNILTTHGIHLVPEKRKIGWVPQDAALFPMLNVAENIAFSLATTLRGVKKLAHSHRIDELLMLIDMTSLRDRMPHELSGGQAQRVALARALAAEPQLVLMDEPFSGLDPVLRSDLRNEVKEILAANKTTALLVTHDQAEALSIADKVVLVNCGRIEQIGTPHEVYNRPTTQWVARFLGDANILSAQRTGDVAHTLFGNSEFVWMGKYPPKQVIEVLVRPESLELTDGNMWTVNSLEYCGHDALLALSDAVGDLIYVRVASQNMRSVGQRVGVTLTGPVLGYERRKS